jgi:hypothetical protein
LVVVEIEGDRKVVPPSVVNKPAVPVSSNTFRKNPDGMETTLSVTCPGPQRLPLIVVGEPLTHGGGIPVSTFADVPAGKLFSAYECTVASTITQRTPTKERLRLFINFMVAKD